MKKGRGNCWTSARARKRVKNNQIDTVCEGCCSHNVKEKKEARRPWIALTRMLQIVTGRHNIFYCRETAGHGDDRGNHEHRYPS